MTSTTRLVLAVSLILCANCLLTAQDNLLFEHINTETGLSQNDVRTVFQDSRGFIWMGTRNGGLNYFDGYGFQHFGKDAGKPDSVEFEEIYGICEDQGGNIWLAGVTGLQVLEADSNSFTTYRFGDSGIEASCTRRTKLLFEEPGTIYAETNRGLAIFDIDTKEFTLLAADSEAENGLDEGNVYSLEKLEDGRLLILCRSRVVHFFDPESGDLTRLPLHSGKHKAHSLVDETIAGMAEQLEDGTILIANRFDGICTVNPRTGELATYSRAFNEFWATLGHPEIMSIVEDYQGRIWVGMRRNGGLVSINPQTRDIRSFRKNLFGAKGIASNHIEHVMVDDAGALWVGTRAGGVTKISRSRFHKITPSLDSGFGVESSAVRGLFRDLEDILWIGTDIGFYSVRLESGTVNYISKLQQNSSPLANIYIISRFDDNNLFIGGVGSGGLHLFDPDSRESRRLVEAEVCRYLIKDSRGTYWLSRGRQPPLNFVLKDAGSNVRLLPTGELPELVKEKYVRCILETRDGSILFATRYGLHCYDPTTGKGFTIDPSTGQAALAPDENIYTAIQAGNGEIWIGTASSGLLKLSEDYSEVWRYGVEHGLADETIYGLAEDQNGTIWVSSNNGLTSISPELQIENFRLKDGLQNLEFNVGAVHRDDHGWLYFGGINGVNYFSPDQLAIIPFEPQTHITAFTSNSFAYFWLKGLTGTKNFELPHNARNMRIDFSSSDHTFIRAAPFRYRLKGYDGTWQKLAGQNSVTYNYLPQGQYLFEVQAGNSDEVWSENTATLSFSVASPFWNTPLFYAACLLALVAVSVNLHKWRLALLKKQKEQLESIVEERTRQLQIKNNQLKKAHKEMESLAATDALTGLINRRRMIELLEYELLRYKRNGMPFVVAMADLDDFKQINDTHGHDCGDFILKKVGNRILTLIRAQDVVARWGGEEFLLLLPNTDIQGGGTVLEKIRQNIAESKFGYSSEMTLTVSMTIGYCQIDEGISIDELIKRADSSLYKGKDQGKNCVASCHRR